MLLYCITEPDAPLDALPSGVGEARVECLEQSGVHCLYSRIETLAAHAESFRTNALRFHGVLSKVFERTSALPFRFPTLLETEQQVREYLQSHAAAHLEDLRRLRGMVQMEVRIQADPFPSAQRNSGAEYLQRRMEQHRTLSDDVARAFLAAEKLICAWKVRNTTGGVRCFALVRREEVNAFKQSMRSLCPSDTATMVVSGPWPPTEFLHAPAH